MPYLQLSDFTDELCLSFNDGAESPTYEISDYIAKIDTEIKVLAAELGVDPDDIDTDYQGDESAGTGRVHPRVIDFGAAYGLTLFFMDKMGLGNDEFDKYERKYKLYQDRAAMYRQSITKSMLTDTVTSTSQLSSNTTIIYHG